MNVIVIHSDSEFNVTIDKLKIKMSFMINGGSWSFSLSFMRTKCHYCLFFKFEYVCCSIIFCQDLGNPSGHFKPEKESSLIYSILKFLTVKFQNSNDKNENITHYLNENYLYYFIYMYIKNSEIKFYFDRKQ